MRMNLLITMTALMLGTQVHVMADDVKTPVDSVIVRDIEEVVVISTPKENQYLRQQTLSSTSYVPLSILFIAGRKQLCLPFHFSRSRIFTILMLTNPSHIRISSLWAKLTSL